MTTRTHDGAPHVVPDATDFVERIAAAARHARDLDDQRDLAHQQRNFLIVEAVDAGVLSQRAAAKAAGLAQSRVLKLLSLSQSELEEFAD